ncbi:MAG TPA: methyltransferase domain-containing protein [Propionibacteriaceae bacterium]|jgi:SAM-dependent methyltransferase
MPQIEERSDDRHTPRRLLGAALVRVAGKVDPSVVRATADLPFSGPPVGRPPDGGCLICHAPGVTRREVEYIADPALRKTVNVCSHCGYVAIDEIGPSHYRAATSVNQLPRPTPRVGTTERPGREFQMAKMALEILGRKAAQDVLVYGAGRSLDNLHIQRLPRAGMVAIADIVKVRDDAPFVDANHPGKKRFSVVVASEVVEHFRDPWSDFATLLGLVKPGGLLVCGTNIHDGRPKLERDRYIYYRDHTSYYSVTAIHRIATAMGFHVDFRLPEGLGRRKRYVLFTRSPAVLDRAATYFGRVALAPTEKTYQRRQERLAQPAG